MAASEQTEEAGPFVERVAALDIGKASLDACLRVPSETHPGGRRQETLKYSTMTDDLVALADHLICQGIELVVMEATGAYWKSPFYVLEAAGLTVWLVNARHVKNVPGRPKTDKLDAIWLCKVAERGMCSPSFVPGKEGRELRNLTRYRTAATRERAREKQRLEKLLEDAGIKLSVVASDIFGVSGRLILEALIAGKRDVGELSELARGRMRPKRGELRRALAGRFEAHHAMLARMMLDHVDQLTAAIAALDAEIAKAVAEVEAASDAGGPPAGVDPATGEILPGPAGGPAGQPPAGGQPAGATPARPSLAERLTEIPGIGMATAQAIIAEVGTDASRFPTPDNLASWAGLAPMARESAGRAKPAKTAKGNRYLAGALGQAVLSLATTQTFYGARYRRLRARRGKKKAIVAVSRSILISIWHLLADPDARYHELGADFYDKRKDPAKQAATHVKQLERLGFQVTITPLEPQAA